jgi:hypothetical protein
MAACSSPILMSFTTQFARTRTAVAAYRNGNCVSRYFAKLLAVMRPILVYCSSDLQGPTRELFDAKLSLYVWKPDFL